jgi:hypothetical protein
MSSNARRVAVALALGALSLPALAGAGGSATNQDCSVCDDPTWPELRSPMPPIVIARDAAIPVLQIDPTWPEIQQPMPVLALTREARDEPADVQTDPTWPAMASVAPAIEVRRLAAQERIVQR